MSSGKPKTIFYKRSNFVTHLPETFLFSPSHWWMARQDENLWRVGMTKFATRMLGEMVDHDFDVASGSTVTPGQVIGWVEGFKALSDIFCIAKGEFAGANPVLKENIVLIGEDPYGSGWVYSVRGEPDEKCVDVNGYRAILDQTIDKILEEQKSDT